MCSNACGLFSEPIWTHSTVKTHIQQPASVTIDPRVLEGLPHSNSDRPLFCLFFRGIEHLTVSTKHEKTFLFFLCLYVLTSHQRYSFALQNDFVAMVPEQKLKRIFFLLELNFIPTVLERWLILFGVAAKACYDLLPASCLAPNTCQIIDDQNVRQKSIFDFA